MAFKINTSSSNGNKSKKSDFPLLPDGEYPLEVEKTRGYKASTGTKMMEVTFNVMSGEYKNRKIWRHFPLTQKAFVFVENLLKASNNTDLLDKEEIDAKELFDGIKGDKVIGVIGSETLKKGPINVVNKFKTYAADSPEPETVAETPEDDSDIFS